MTPEYKMLMDVLLRRTSVRRFKPDPLPEGTVDKILEAGRWAMSGANSQPWEFIVVRDPRLRSRFGKRILISLPHIHSGWNRCEWMICDILHFKYRGLPTNNGNIIKGKTRMDGLWLLH